MTDIIINGILLGLLLSVLPGPAFFELLHTSLKRGFWHAVFFSLGVLVSDFLYILVAYYGTTFLLQIPNYPYYFRIVGGSFIFVFGAFRLISKPKLARKEVNVKYRAGNLLSNTFKGIFLNSLNPGVLFFWSAALLYASTEFEATFKNILLYFAIGLGVFFVIDLLKAMGASYLKSHLSNRILRLISQVVGVIFMILGVFVIVQAFQIK